MDIMCEEGAVIVRTSCFEPMQIFENGQAFRFTSCGENAYHGVAYGRYLRVEKREDTVRFSPCTKQEFEEIWRHYFDFDRDYNALFCDCEDAALARGREYGCGLRMLNQQPFETLISFIVSANNNIGRIRGIIAKICELAGEQFSYNGEIYYRFPTPNALAELSCEELVTCGSGYRAPYIKRTAKLIADGFSLEELKSKKYADAKAALQTLPGVGPKVADCVLLFSLGFHDAFPADVHVKRVLRDNYGFEGNDKQIYEFAKERFGEYAGIAQQYLFFRQLTDTAKK
ncbi:MAG: DNA glycosylase [Christensenella sp.]